MEEQHTTRSEMVKPNDTIALIIGLHVVVLALIAWLLFRFVRVFPADYSITSTSYSSDSSGPNIRVPPQPFSPFAPGGRGNTMSGATRVRYSGPAPGPSGKVNAGRNPGRGPGAGINVVNVEPA